MSVGNRLRVGVVGLGDIAGKAYLPVLAARDDVELSVMSRNADTVGRIARQYAVRQATTRLDELIDGGLDAAFVHASTEAHAALVDRLLRAGIPVLVDKPLAPDLRTARQLVELAEGQGCSLSVGFNRRWAPAYRRLAEVSRSVVLLQKNRAGLPDEPRRLVFDDFIHVVDTLRFLMPPGEEQVGVRCGTAAGLLRTVVLDLQVDEVTGLGVMSRVSGADEEILQVLGDGHTHRVVDLAQIWRAQDGDRDGVRLVRRADWTPVPTQRGFTDMCSAFLTAVREGRVLSARDALRTHEICEDVVHDAEAALGR